VDLAIVLAPPRDRSRFGRSVSAPCPEFGFVLQATFDAREAERKEIVGAFTGELIELLESNGLTTHGAVDGVHHDDERPDGVAVIFNITREGAQATDTDRQLIAEWANRWAKIAHVTVSDLVDLSELAE
jgi:hypothetical protein